MPFLRDFDELVGQKRSSGDELDEATRIGTQTSTLSERIKALETAGIIDSFVKKRVPPYAAAAAAVGSSLQDTDSVNVSTEPNKPLTKIYRNPSTGFHAQQTASKNKLAASSSTNLHSSSSRESLASNEAAPGGLATNLYRSTSVDSIENELPCPTSTTNNELPSSFQSELVDRIKSLRKVSSPGILMAGKDVTPGSEIPISIPLESVNRISISSASPSPAAKPVESNSSSSLSSSLNKPVDSTVGDDLYKTSFVIYPGPEPRSPGPSPAQQPLSHRSHSPIPTLDFKIPLPTHAHLHHPNATNKTIIHIDSQFTTTGASSPASYTADLPYAKSTATYIQDPSASNNLPSNRSQLVSFVHHFNKKSTRLFFCCCFCRHCCGFAIFLLLLLLLSAAARINTIVF